MARLHEFGYEHDGVRLTGQLASPEGPGPHPAVLVLHSALGIDDDACRRAADLAALGYVALAADMYGKGRDLDREQMGRSFVELQTDPGLLRARVVAAFDAVRVVAGVDEARIVCARILLRGAVRPRAGPQRRRDTRGGQLPRTAQDGEPGVRRGAVTAKSAQHQRRQGPLSSRQRTWRCSSGRWPTPTSTGR